MIRNLTNSISNVSTGPINKPLVADNHDYMGNLLGPSVFFEDAFAFNYFGNTLYWVNASIPFDVNNNFSLGGNTYSTTAATVLYSNVPGGTGPHTYISIQASNISGGTGLRDIVYGQTLGQTLGIRVSGSGGSSDYYPLVLGSTSDFEWFPTGSNTNIINLKVEFGGTFTPWESNGTPYGPTASVGTTDVLTLTWLE